MYWINSINSTNVARTQINLWCIYLKASKILEIRDGVERNSPASEMDMETASQPGRDVDEQEQR